MELALLATEEGPLLVVTRDAGPRVAVFGGDTTHTAWCQNEDAVRPFERFWNQLIAWLARQEDGDSQVSVKLDKRRIAAGANLKLGFTVSAIGKDGQPITNARYTVKVQGPGGELFDVPTGLKLGEERGAFGQANVVGEYKLIVTATAPGPQGQEVPLGFASARFMGFAEDVENQQPAANHKDLNKVGARRAAARSSLSAGEGRAASVFARAARPPDGAGMGQARPVAQLENAPGVGRLE